MTVEEHGAYCKERIQMFTEMMERCYTNNKKE